MELEIITSDNRWAPVILSADTEPVYEVYSDQARASTQLTSARHYADEYILRRRIRDVFGRVPVRATTEIDPEEGWTQEVLVVHTGIEDVDARMAREEAFYALLDGNAEFMEALRLITVVFE